VSQQRIDLSGCATVEDALDRIAAFTDRVLDDVTRDSAARMVRDDVDVEDIEWFIRESRVQHLRCRAQVLQQARELLKDR
jgi:hypothetical protein